MYVRMYVCVCIYAFNYVVLYACMYGRMYVCMYICLCGRVYMYVCMYMNNFRFVCHVISLAVAQNKSTHTCFHIHKF